MKEILLWLWQHLFHGRKEKIEPVIQGYDDLLGHWAKLIEPLEKRIEECEEDRAELHRRVDECDQDRRELRAKVANVEYKIEDLEERTSL